MYAAIRPVIATPCYTRQFCYAYLASLLAKQYHFQAPA